MKAVQYLNGEATTSTIKCNLKSRKRVFEWNDWIGGGNRNGEYLKL